MTKRRLNPVAPTDGIVWTGQGKLVDRLAKAADNRMKPFEERQHDVQGILGELIAREQGVPANIKRRIEQPTPAPPAQ
ncbi:MULTISPECIES: hypothetical protein [Pseudomonas]|uniref:Uncharacterized protein n=3 Tax=Pseudomonas TaxID=286 RepID=A0A0G3GBK0_9PSED|nr:MULTISPECIES: hypothetical protein [Pseudomonas]AKJ98590.1 hypothetical protein VM99_11180 [Pseudomonas chlororaphis]KIQ59723.1 hypothetical protein RL74_09125 [Pseudomonas fluorescens]ROM86050.1 hypothetical protein BK652_05595 [Pseudomonas brassicacearum]